LIIRGIPVKIACRAAVSEALTDDRELLAAMDEMISSLF
jgi:nitric oxide reductase NorQ protein